MIFFAGPLIAFAAVVLIILILRPVAERIGLLDQPNTRSSHETPTPMVGGLLSATVLTLLIIPAIYMIWKGRGLRRRIVEEFRSGSRAA